MNVCLCNHCHRPIDGSVEYCRGEMMVLCGGIPPRPMTGTVHPRRYVHYHLGCYDTVCRTIEEALSTRLGVCFCGRDPEQDEESKSQEDNKHVSP